MQVSCAIDTNLEWSKDIEHCSIDFEPQNNRLRINVNKQLQLKYIKAIILITKTVRTDFLYHKTFFSIVLD